mgnify:CR=1 FL=1
MEKTKDEKTFSDTLGGFFEKTQKFWIVFLILLVVVSIAIGVITTISSKSKLKGANFLDSAVFNYFKSKSTLEGDEFEIGFSSKYLLDALRASDNDIITLKIQDGMVKKLKRTPVWLKCFFLCLFCGALSYGRRSFLEKGV